jgi:hypothetical protein
VVAKLNVVLGQAYATNDRVQGGMTFQHMGLENHGLCWPAGYQIQVLLLSLVTAENKQPL